MSQHKFTDEEINIFNLELNTIQTLINLNKMNQGHFLQTNNKEFYQEKINHCTTLLEKIKVIKNKLHKQKVEKEELLQAKKYVENRLSSQENDTLIPPSHIYKYGSPFECNIL